MQPSARNKTYRIGVESYACDSNKKADGELCFFSWPGKYL